MQVKSPARINGPARANARFDGRWLDTFIVINVFQFALLLLQVPLFIFIRNGEFDRLLESPDAMVLGFFGVFALAVAYDTILLPTWGTTPGKALAGLRVRRADGRKLTFQEALRRSIFLQVYGMALNLLVVTFFCHWKAYDMLERRGYTYWDAFARHQVLQEEIGIRRKVLAVLVAVLVWVVLILGYYLP